MPGQPTVNDVVLEFHEMTREVFYRERKIRLTRKEYHILLVLYDESNGICSREALLANVWGQDVFVEPRTIDRHIVKLRRKLQSLSLSDFAIDTVWGIGYRLRIIDPSSG